MKTINPSIFRNLLQAAKEVAENAYAPYSKFKVGAALITENEEIFTGCNVENASYGLTICAERNAIGTMVAKGYKKFEAIAVYSPQNAECYPCGACRQWLNEFGPEAYVIVEDANREIIITSVSDLLPKAFGPSNLA